MNEMTNVGVSPEMQGGSEQPTAAPVKSIDQDRLNDLIRNAHERGKQKGYEQAKIDANNIPNSPHTAPVMDQVAINKVIADQVKSHMADNQRMQLEDMQRKEGKRILDEIATKVNSTAESKRYPDFDEVTRQVPFHQMPEILHLANTADNTGDVLYDLAKNPSKIATLRGLPPELARQEVMKLSNSIKMNQAAAEKELPPDPGSQIKPSNFGNDKRSTNASDYRSKYKGRG